MHTARTLKRGVGTCLAEELLEGVDDHPVNTLTQFPRIMYRPLANYGSIARAAGRSMARSLSSTAATPVAPPSPVEKVPPPATPSPPTSPALAVPSRSWLEPVSLNPAQVVEALSQHIVGQLEAKKAIAIALRNRWRRMRLSPAQQAEIIPKNILMVRALAWVFAGPCCWIAT